MCEKTLGSGDWKIYYVRKNRKKLGSGDWERGYTYITYLVGVVTAVRRAGDFEGCEGLGMEEPPGVRGDFFLAAPGADEVRGDFPLLTGGVVKGRAMPVDLVRRSALAAVFE